MLILAFGGFLLYLPFCVISILFWFFLLNRYRKEPDLVYEYEENPSYFLSVISLFISFVLLCIAICLIMASILVPVIEKANYRKEINNRTFQSIRTINVFLTETKIVDKQVSVEKIAKKYADEINANKEKYKKYLRANLEILNTLKHSIMRYAFATMDVYQSGSLVKYDDCASGNSKYCWVIYNYNAPPKINGTLGGWRYYIHYDDSIVGPKKF